MLLSQWWELEETAIRCELGMWGRKWQAKKKKKDKKRHYQCFCLFFFLSLYTVLFARLLCIILPASYGEGNPTLLHPRHTSVSPRAFSDQGSWEAERCQEGGREASSRLRAVKALAHLSTVQRATGRLQLPFQGLHEVVTFISPFFWWFIFLRAWCLSTVLHLLHAKHPFIPHKGFLQLS